ncbi:MAG TPA: hydrogenase nickel incorporation protein HypB [Syntrophomonadaceae bacterium]|jgi:hydrogenase nickel incorporation protein HypB|nr:hydrogenase nickel incorporation protein HypB [Syntrophomonadaceae bacterium]HOQ09958.1 hydrogenase nickel incorporation protein HypB [Syntrophomonadaceae bacterium]HPU49424.1 hydrogenase nickel incorporation protein HypB [Syntrophomonadaceae bacterium]
MKVKLETRLLGANELIAHNNRTIFSNQGVLVINLMSSPGSGKTTILEKTISRLKDQIKIAVIEGDLYTDQDAQRIEQQGVKVVQINTEGTCHLDAGMVSHACQELLADNPDLLVVENVGNLVCPAEFDLGEDLRAVVISVPEGNDKITKYPLVFQRADVILVNKMDLLPFTDFDVARVQKDIGLINPKTKIFFVSARNGDGLEEWSSWLLEQIHAKGRTKLM